MIIYFDGGNYNDPEVKHAFNLTYGVLLHNGDDEPIESFGQHYCSSKMQVHKGNHEMVAFVEAYKLLKENNINYKDVSFYADSDLLYAQSILHEDNYRVEPKQKFLHNLDLALKLVGLESEKENIIDCVKNCRIVKVKAHSHIVDNIRVDYLSKIANAKKAPINYAKFLECSFFKYTENGIIQFNLPFMKEDKALMIKI